MDPSRNAIYFSHRGGSQQDNERSLPPRFKVSSLMSPDESSVPNLIRMWHLNDPRLVGGCKLLPDRLMNPLKSLQPDKQRSRGT